MTFDPELFLLREGQRSLVKRERVPIAEVGAIAREHAGLETATVLSYGRGEGDHIELERDGFTTVLIARDRTTIDRAIELVRAQHDVDLPGDAQIAAIVEQGRLLGYPACCVDAHVRGPNGPWFTHGADGYVLDGIHRTEGAPHALLNPFVRPGFVTRSVCRYDCAPSIELAERVFREARRRDRAWADAQRAKMEQPVLVWTRDRFVSFEGTWDGDTLHYRRAHLPDPHLPDPHLPDPHLPLAHLPLAHLPLPRNVGGGRGEGDSFARSLLTRGNALFWQPGSAVVLDGDRPIGALADIEPLRFPTLLAWGHRAPWPRAPKIALLEMRTTGQHFFGNDLALLGGDLRAMGIDASLYYAEVGREDGAREHYDAIAAAMHARGVTLVVADSALSHALLRAIGAHRIPRVLLAASAHDPPDIAEHTLGTADEEGPRVDRPRVLRRLLEIAGGAGELALPTPSHDPLALPFTPLVEYADVPGVPRRTLEQFYLRGNLGCPYSKRYSDRDAASYLPKERKRVRLRGCNFCSSGGDYRRLADHDVMAAHLADRIAWLARHAPSITRYVIGDTYPMPYLGELVRRIDTRHKEILVQTRPDWLLRMRDEIESLLPSLEARELTLALYLIGFENFSQAELDRLDKGLTVEQNERAIALLYALEARHPRAFSARKYASHGFLLFNPWTTLDDLRANAAVIERTRFHELRGSFLLSRLRLYPYHPFFHKARAAGLLIDAYDRPERSSARRIGYAAEHPWRAADPRVDAVFDAVATLHDEIDPASHARLLDRAVALVLAGELSIDRLRAELPAARPPLREGPIEIERFGPLARGDELAPGCAITALHLDASRLRIDTTLAPFAIDAPGGASGPFDAAGLGIWYYASDLPFARIEPAGRRLRALFAPLAARGSALFSELEQRARVVVVERH
jgi:hypothetical protein